MELPGILHVTGLHPPHPGEPGADPLTPSRDAAATQAIPERSRIRPHRNPAPAGQGAPAHNRRESPVILTMIWIDSVLHPNRGTCHSAPLPAVFLPRASAQPGGGYKIDNTRRGSGSRVPHIKVGQSGWGRSRARCEACRRRQLACSGFASSLSGGFPSRPGHGLVHPPSPAESTRKWKGS